MHIKRSVSNIENIENIVVIIVFFVASHREYREYRGFNSVFITSHREYREYHCFLQCYQFRMFYVTREYSMLTLLSRLTLAHTCIFFFWFYVFHGRPQQVCKLLCTVGNGNTSALSGLAAGRKCPAVCVLLAQGRTSTEGHARGSSITPASA